MTERIPLSEEDYKNCQALDADGKQCRNKGIRTVKYHGDNEIYSSWMSDKFPISWVKIKVCKGHFEENFKN